MKYSRQGSRARRSAASQSGMGSAAASPGSSGPGAHPPVEQMEPGEVKAWLTDHLTELESYCVFALDYVEGRKRRGRETYTDHRIRQFLAWNDDLRTGLKAIRALAEQAEANQKNQNIP